MENELTLGIEELEPRIAPSVGAATHDNPCGAELVLPL